MYSQSSTMIRISLQITYFLLLTMTCASCTNKSENPSSKLEKQTPTNSPEIKPEEPQQDWPQLGKIKEFFSAFAAENHEKRVLLKTRLGNIEIELFEDTPLHRANFIHNIKRGLYFKTIFYRV